MSDTDEIDKKKEEETTDTETAASKLGNFLKTMGGIVVFVVIYYSLGGLILFSCKVAQSNVLPTDENCAPYTNQAPVFKNKSSEMNIFKSAFFDPESSEKISIEYTTDNTKSQILDMLRAYKEKSNSNNIGNYMVSFIQKLIAFLFNIVNMMLNMANQLPEAFIILGGPIASMIALPFIAIVGIIYSIILWFKEMNWLFKKNTNETGDGPPVWEDVSGFKELSVSWILVVVFFWIFVILFAIQGFSSLVFLILLFISFSILMIKGTMNNKKVGSSNIIKDVFRYYKVIIAVLITLSVVLNAFGILGTVPGVFSIVTVGLIYFGIVGINLYEPILPQHSTPILPNDEQFIKLCSIPKGAAPAATKKGFFTSLFSGKGGGGGGGAKNLVREIKKLGKLNK
jgi:hypothetical protein